MRLARQNADLGNGTTQQTPRLARRGGAAIAATIDELLARARDRLDRVPAEALAGLVGAGAVVVDIRPIDLRERDGEMPGALIIDRNQLLWRLAPSSETRIVDVDDGRPVILFCDEGYASSLAAVSLHEVGVAGATDLVGGYRAWRRLEGGRTMAPPPSEETPI